MIEFMCDDEGDQWRLVVGVDVVFSESRSRRSDVYRTINPVEMPESYEYAVVRAASRR